MSWRRSVLVALGALTGVLAAGYHSLAAQNAQGQTAKSAPAPLAPNSADIARLRAAAAGGDSQAQYDLALALDCGRGLKRDRARAIEWLRQSADQGHVGAQSALGWKYMTGHGVLRDDKAAFEWLRRAAERGDTSAQNNLGVLYAQGRGVPTDLNEAAKWFQLAAEKGAADAQRNLDALLAGRGRDVRKSTGPPLPRT